MFTTLKVCQHGSVYRLLKVSLQYFTVYLEEGAVGLQCAGEVVGVGAAEAVAAARGSGLLTVSAA